MPARRIEEVIERLSDAPLPDIRKALRDRVNLVAAKAAKVAADRRAQELVPDLLAAYDRLYIDPVKSDPQCWGKVAIAKALRDLEYRESPPFRRGLKHVQLEPVWGKLEDSAQTLRGVCLLALVACTDVARAEVLRSLVDALTEGEPAVRLDAVRGLAEMEGEEAALLLRMKARIGDDEPQIIGTVFDGLTKVEGDSALPFLARFFESPDEELRVEAALAIGASRSAEGAELLKSALEQTRNPSFREVLIRALGASRQTAAVEYLKMQLKVGRSSDAAALREALEGYREDPEIRGLLERSTANERD